MARAASLGNKVRGAAAALALASCCSHAAPVMDRRSTHRDQVDTSASSFVFSTTPLATCLGIACLPCTLLGMPTTIPPRHEAVGTVFGKYIGACGVLRDCPTPSPPRAQLAAQQRSPAAAACTPVALTRERARS
jgi:hypothetical protein